MFDEFFFFTYIIAGFIGFLAILLAALLKKYWSSGNKQLLASILNFMICTACIDAMYFYLNYVFLKTGCYTTTALPRVLDSFTYIGQVYFWAAYIRQKCQLPPEKRKSMTFISLCLCGLCLVTNLASYGFFMDDYYFVPAGTLRDLSIIIEVILMFCLTFITVWHLMKGLSELVQKKIRILVTVISVFITINGLWNAVLSLILMTGVLSPPRDFAMDPTGFFVLLINFFTILLIYQEDFFALFRIDGTPAEALEADRQKNSPENETKPEENPKNPEAPLPSPFLETVPDSSAKSSIKDRLDSIAQSHSLTQREREVLELAYKGMTNPEIADELIISKYTVKRHMHNIFEKLDISTRMELVHLIGRASSTGNGPGGPL